MREIWKDIIGYEGIYQISSFGRVKSLDREEYVPGFSRRRIRKGRILAQTKTRNLGLSLEICLDNKDAAKILQQELDRLDGKPHIPTSLAP